MIKKNLEIHSENILPIIKKSIYSSKDIFIRELVSNACDAIHKVKVLTDSGENVSEQNDSFRIEVLLDKEAKTLKFIDNGIGMDAEEVQKYIAQIAFSGAEEFIEKYQTQKEGDQFIGHFGLGFYSAYMVASKVDIDTLSYKKGATPVFWSCDGSSEYELGDGQRTSRGTTITLHIDNDSDEFLDPAHIAALLEHYCAFLAYPIYLGERLINTHQPLWIKAPAECTNEDYLQFYKYLYPQDDEPLFWLHLNVDYPFHLKGILYFPKLHQDFDFKKSTVKLYCNRVFVADNCKDVLPEYLMALRGVIDSPDIPLNVSRSYLQMDRTVKQLGGHIAKKVADSLLALWRSDHDRFTSSWEDLSTVIKLGAIEDEKFYDRIKELLLWKTVEGTWTTAEQYLERNKDKTDNKIYYTRDEHHATDLLELYKQKNIEVICAPHLLDSYLMQFLERKIPGAKFLRFDSSISDSLIDSSREKVLLDADGKTEATHLANLIRTKLPDDKIDVEAKSLANDALPAFILIPEDDRRMRDYLRRMNQGKEELPIFGKTKFIVNTNNPLINALPKLEKLNPSLAKEVIQQTYELALLSQREIDMKALNAFISRTSHVLEKLAVQATEK